jgi:hypothetical protein
MDMDTSIPAHFSTESSVRGNPWISRFPDRTVCGEIP